MWFEKWQDNITCQENMLSGGRNKMRVSLDVDKPDRQETDHKNDKSRAFITASLRILGNPKQFTNKDPEMVMHSDTSNENQFHFDCLSCVPA